MLGLENEEGRQLQKHSSCYSRLVFESPASINGEAARDGLFPLLKVMAYQSTSSSKYSYVQLIIANDSTM